MTLENVGRGVLHPSVEVDFVDNLPAGYGDLRRVFAVFAEDLRVKLLHEIQGAFGWDDEEL